jgi:phosphoribosylglycinamide formyltransferase 1
MRLALLASGRGSNVAAILEEIAAGRLRADAVLLICDRPGARVIEVATRAGVPVLVLSRADHATRDSWDEAILAALTRARADLVALAGFSAILGPAVVDAFPARIVNIHPSLLPAFAGMVAPGPQAAALAAGVSVSGCTVHVVTTDVDGGPILAQARVPVLPDDTVETLSDRILEAEHRLYPEVIGWFVERAVNVRGDAVTAPPA